jgi:uncharacterized protein (TIGR00369 family)
MSPDSHHRALERMYVGAPINQFFRPRIRIAHETAEIEMEVREDFHHAAGAAHGAVYFKMLDDAAFFAANSVETEVFVLTTAFTTYLTRPISSGQMRATGRVVNRNRSQIVAEAVVRNADGIEVGRGSGLFVRSKVRLADLPTYRRDA